MINVFNVVCLSVRLSLCLVVYYFHIYVLMSPAAWLEQLNKWLVKKCWSYVPSLPTEFLKQVERLCVVWDENDFVGRCGLDHCEEIVQHLHFTWDRHKSQCPSENSIINDELHVHPAWLLITPRRNPYCFLGRHHADILERHFSYGAYFVTLANHASFAWTYYGIITFGYNLHEVCTLDLIVA